MTATVTVRAQQGERLDQLVWRTNGGGPAAFEVVLAANRGLAAIALNLPEGHSVQIPQTPPATSNVDLVQLWD